MITAGTAYIVSNAVCQVKLIYDIMVYSKDTADVGVA